MGAISFSLDRKLVAALRDALPLEVFVETGTFRGDTLEVVKDCFEEIYSIESSPEYYEQSRRRFGDTTSIELVLGDSASSLHELAPRVRDKPVLYFLDAHWCMASHTNENLSQCPLIAELRAIHALGPDSAIVIDDARLFLSTPPAPHEASQWPVFGDVVQALRDLSDRHELMVVNDCILYYPYRARAAVKEFAREHGVDWLKICHENRQAESQIGALQEICAQRDEELKNKEREIQSLARMRRRLRNKEGVIRTLGRGIQGRDLLRPGGSFLGKGVASARYLLSPKLGRLAHHPPIPIRVPPPYIRATTTEKLPGISVVTPSLNQALFLERTMKSVLGQDYPRLEYFIEDGGSQDGTIEILERYRGQLDGFESAPDRGQAHAVNRGFARSSGEIMSWLNSDDWLLPGALECVGDYFARHPEVDVVYGNRVLIDEDGMEIGRWILPPHDNKVLSWADFVPQETLFWRRSVWEKAGGRVDEDFHFALDWDLLLRFRDVGARMVRLPRLLGAFRIHASQKTSAVIDDVGFEEMDRLRKRCTGLERISEGQIHRMLVPYLMRHIVHDLGWRVRQRLGVGGTARARGSGTRKSEDTA